MNWLFVETFPARRLHCCRNSHRRGHGKYSNSPRDALDRGPTDCMARCAGRSNLQHAEGNRSLSSATGIGIGESYLAIVRSRLSVTSATPRRPTGAKLTPPTTRFAAGGKERSAPNHADPQIRDPTRGVNVDEQMVARQFLRIRLVREGGLTRQVVCLSYRVRPTLSPK